MAAQPVSQLYKREAPLAKCNELTGLPSTKPPDGTFEGTDSKQRSAVLSKATASDLC